MFKLEKELKQKNMVGLVELVSEYFEMLSEEIGDFNVTQIDIEEFFFDKHSRKSVQPNFDLFKAKNNPHLYTVDVLEDTNIVFNLHTTIQNIDYYIEINVS